MNIQWFGFSTAAQTTATETTYSYGFVRIYREEGKLKVEGLRQEIPTWDGQVWHLNLPSQKLRIYFYYHESDGIDLAKVMAIAKQVVWKFWGDKGSSISEE